MGIAKGAVYSDAGKDAPHVALADEVVRIGPPLAAASAPSIALATFACGRPASLYGERTYLAMTGHVLALFAAALTRRI